jgi:hypothetical protein
MERNGLRSLRIFVMASLVVGLAAGAQAQTPSEGKARAISWLLAHQNPSGTWGADPRGELLATSTAVRALRAAGVSSPQVRRAEAWLGSQGPASTEDIAQLAIALDDSDLGLDVSDLTSEIVARQVSHDAFTIDLTIYGYGNLDLPREYGWGSYTKHRANLIDSAVAMRALKQTGATVPNLSTSISHLRDAQNTSGGDSGGWPLTRHIILTQLFNWTGFSSSVASEVAATAEVTRAANWLLVHDGSLATDISEAIAWLRTQQNGDGGWGKDGVSSLEETAAVYIAMRESGIASSDGDLTAAMSGFLLPAQISSVSDPDFGSWDAKAYRTALALEAIESSGLATDTDGDGTPDATDTDDDDDGIPDVLDLFPLDANESFDLDRDGLGDGIDPDRDGDGSCDPGESGPGCTGTDAYPDDPNSHADSDGDGTPDALDGDIDGDGVGNTADAFPFDPSETLDSDRDGIGDNDDPDDDNDGIDDAADPDDDNDGILDELDNCPVNPAHCLWEVAQLTNNATSESSQGVGGGNLVWQARSGGNDEIFYHEAATAGTLQVTDNTRADRNPRISGTNVVWEGNDGSDYEIFLYRGATGTTLQLTDNGQDDALPEISGSYVAWEEFDGSDYEIFLYTISSQTTTQITSNSGDDSRVRLSSPWLAFTGHDGSDYEVFLHDAVNEVTTQLTSDGVDQDDLAIATTGAGQRLAWCGGLPSQRNCFVYHPGNGTLTQILSGGDQAGSVAISGDLVVWSEWDGNDFELFLHDLTTTVTTQITDDAFDDLLPRISKPHVVWESLDATFLQPQVFVYDADTATTTQLTHHSLSVPTPIAAQVENAIAAWAGSAPGSSNVDVFRARLVPPACDDAADNDWDGFVDYPDDPGCRWATSVKEDPQCNDGLDNDNDGKIDMLDPHCTDPWDNKEKGGGGGGSCGLGGIESMLLVGLVLSLTRRRRRRIRDTVRPENSCL